MTSHSVKPARNLFFNTVVLAVPSFILYLFIIAFSKFSQTIAPQLTTNMSNVLWVGFFTLILLSVGSFMLSGMVGLALIEKEKMTFFEAVRRFCTTGARFWLNNLLPIIVVLSIGALSNFLSAHIAGFSIPLLGEQGAFIFLLVLLVAGLCGVVSFFTLASAYLVAYSLSPLESIMASVRAVRRNYLSVTPVVFGFFIVSSIIEMCASNGMLPIRVSELIQALILFPSFVSTLVFLTTKLGLSHDLRTG